MFLTVAALLPLFAPRDAAAQLTSFRVASGLSNPLYATNTPSRPNDLFIVQKGGLIRRLDLTTNTLAATPFLNVAAAGANFLGSGGEQGLLGLAFHPNFASNGFMYVNYTYGTGAGNTRVERYTYDFNTQAVVTTSKQTVLEFVQPETNHNGGWMGFSPRDNYLYIASGDGGGGNDPQGNGQNRNTLLGKMLRVDINSDDFPAVNRNYGIPLSNPFVGQVNTRGEIWAFGLRNPWRNSFDRSTHDLWIADVGQGLNEEVNFQPAASAGGANYGWRLREGFDATPGVGGPKPLGAIDPILDYDHSQGNSITGGYVYRGGNILDNGQNLDGTYFFADFSFSRIWSTRYNGVNPPTVIERTGELDVATNFGTIGNVSSFGEDALGRLYVVDFGGEVFRIQGPAIPEPSAWVMLLIAAAGGGWWSARRGKRRLATVQRAN